jgi:glycosyltransferase involved in cell wall biosynthesis
MRWQLNRADAVATVSNTAKQELIEAHATKRPIHTVSNAVSQDFTPTIDTPHYASNDVVYMGAFTPYKNVECLINALQYATDITLHLCSKVPIGRKKQLVALADTLGVAERIVWHNGISDTNYQLLLESARCSISASKIEGFGLPVLEAQSKGVPMLCSDIPIFHEVGDDSVLYFDHTNPEEAAVLITQLANKQTSKNLIALGYENAKRYTWQNSANAAIENIIKKLPQ